MLKSLLNQCNLTLNLKAVSPLLIKQGETDDEQKKRIKQEKEINGEGGAIHMRFIRDKKGRGDIYLPGSSIRGMTRSFVEKIIRTLSQDSEGFKCCDPFNEEISCSKRLDAQNAKKITDGPRPRAYQQSCPVCKLFGNTTLGSRITFTDAYPHPIPAKGESEEQLKRDLAYDCLPYRDSVPIDRFTGGAIAPFRYEYVIDRTFQTTITIRNFELWQLGLLAYFLRDLKEELLHLGFGKSRTGFGKVKGDLERVEFIYLGKPLPPGLNTLRGLGSLYPDDKEPRYGLAGGADDVISPDCEFLKEETTDGEDTSMRYRYTYVVKDEYKDKKIWAWLAPKWNNYLNDNSKCPPIVSQLA